MCREPSERIGGFIADARPSCVADSRWDCGETVRRATARDAWTVESTLVAGILGHETEAVVLLTTDEDRVRLHPPLWFGPLGRRLAQAIRGPRANCWSTESHTMYTGRTRGRGLGCHSLLRRARMGSTMLARHAG